MQLEKINTIEKQPGFTASLPKHDNTEEFYVNMGPQHPSTHGVLRLVIQLDGEYVREVVPHLGYIHRSIEKMGENKNYVQYIHLTDRMDYLCAHHNNHCVALAVEKACDIGVPERAEYIRVIVSELQRIQSHLLWWGVFGMDLGAITAFLYGFKERERITMLFDEICGARLTMNYFRPGGVFVDVPDFFEAKVQEILEFIKPSLDEYRTLLTGNSILQERTKGIGLLSKETAINYGCSGPVLRGSGVSYDLRKNAPYSLYPDLEFDVPIGTDGDCWDRYWIRMEEMAQSVKIIEQCLSRFPKEGPVKSKTKPSIKPPKGTHFAQVETARGIFGTWFVSDGTDKPYRIKSRSPNFSNLSVINEMVKGLKIADLVTVLSTLDLVIPDIDR